MNLTTAVVVGNNRTVLYTSNGGVSSIAADLPIISDFKLEHNYPDPFNPSTKIKFTIPASPYPSPGKGEETRERFFVNLWIFDVSGNKIATLVNEEFSAGEYEVEFSAGKESFPVLSSGIFFYTLRAGKFSQTRKMIYLK